jgi:hypothetical protein
MQSYEDYSIRQTVLRCFSGIALHYSVYHEVCIFDSYLIVSAYAIESPVISAESDPSCLKCVLLMRYLELYLAES